MLLDKFQRFVLLLPATAFLLCGSSCSDQSPPQAEPPVPAEVTSPPAITPPATAPNAMTSMDVPTSDADLPTWSAPADWQQLPADGIRRATWKIPGPDNSSAELTVTVFPGDVGGLPANIMRWRRQLGLPPAADQNASEQLAGSQLPITVVALNGTNGQSICVGVLPNQGRTWFFKMMGDSAAINSQADAFRNFLRSVQL